ncbi:PorT family protein [Fulvivirga sp. RKSG066]|uniref:porin family protein n=1 Tax=Fulvivirga aurantia TaxID=2529383 RepID=UPI0012BD61B9|nr:porin family protein [Fulvivirga aurantia]MTI21135.1 PorT family protein [Fulvivirga aurantia]
MKRVHLIFCLLCISCLSYNEVHAQESCSAILTNATESFDRGHLYGIPSILKPCLDGGFSKSQKIQAYWLLTRTYLLIDDPISAEDSYIKLLRLDPEYKIDKERDPVDVVYLSEKFTTTPIFVLFAKAGTNFSNANVIHNFGTDNTAQSSEKYKSKTGFQASLGSELNLGDNLSLGAELMFMRMNYAYKNTLFGNDVQSFEERLAAFSVPLYLKYRFKYDKVRPFVYLGVSNDFYLQSNVNVSLIDKSNASNEGDVAEFPVTGPDITVTDQRNFYNTSLFLGLGANYRIGYNYIFLDVRYNVGLSNIVDENNQYANSELLFKYGYVDDYKRLSNLAISVGFVKPLYKPRKKTDIKGFFRKILKKN